MRDYLTLGPTPCDEHCIPCGENPQLETKECKAYRNQLWRIIYKEHNVDPNNEESLDQFHGPRDSFNLTIKSNNHDHGVYREVNAAFNDDDEASTKLAYWLESNTPLEWDDEAKKELGQDYLDWIAERYQ